MKLLSYVFIIVGILFQGVFIAVEHKEKYVLADILKGSASLMFVLLGYLGADLTNPTSKYIFIGLILGMIGDILLNLRFVFEKIGQKIFLTGIVAFLAGHILYLLALIPLAQHVWIWYCIIIGIILAAALLTYIFKTMEVKIAFKVFGVIYLGAVIVMTCIALGIAIFAPNTSAIVYAIGAVLFTASDIVLIFNTFSGVTKFSLRITNLSLYYLGQVLIASSLYFLA